MQKNSRSSSLGQKKRPQEEISKASSSSSSSSQIQHQQQKQQQQISRNPENPKNSKNSNSELFQQQEQQFIKIPTIQNNSIQNIATSTTATITNKSHNSSNNNNNNNNLPEFIKNINISARFSSLQLCHPELSQDNKIFSRYLSTFQSSSSPLGSLPQVQEFVSFLSTLLLQPEYTYSVARAFAPLLSLMVSHLIETNMRSHPHSIHDSSKANFMALAQRMHDQKTIALSKLLPYHPHLLDFLIHHLDSSTEKSSSFLDRISSTPSDTDNNNNNNNNNNSNNYPINSADRKELIRAAFRLLHHAPHIFAQKWNWAAFFRLLDPKAEGTTSIKNKVEKDDDTEIKWYAARCISTLVQLSEVDSDALLAKASNNRISVLQSLDRRLAELEHDSFERRLMIASDFHDAIPQASYPDQRSSNFAVIASHNSHATDSMVNVCGVWLQKKHVSKR